MSEMIKKYNERIMSYIEKYGLNDALNHFLKDLLQEEFDNWIDEEFDRQIHDEMGD
jgi:hypothetical protein